MVRMVKRGGRYLKGAAFGKLGFCTSWAVSAHGGGPEWIEVVDMPLQLRKTPQAFKGKRIVHVSDLHCSSTVSGKYLKCCIERINALDADYVLLTGDYITCDYSGRYRKKVVKLLGAIQSRNGVFACLGNHDYGLNLPPEEQNDMADRIIKELADSGVSVLRNEAAALKIKNEQLWLVGLGDVWVDDFKPKQAFKGVGRSDAVIVLSHNPESVDLLHKYRVDAVMSGHTHGVGLGIRVKEGKHRIAIHDYRRGMYKVGDKKLYVNRGLGRHGKMFYNSRPEITVFNLC